MPSNSSESARRNNLEDWDGKEASPPQVVSESAGRRILDAATFRSLAEALTGTPVKELTARDEAFLGQILQDGERQIDCSQINELLLLVNKDRMEPPFFDRFFQPPCRVAMLRDGVNRFQKMALLRYGNFIYAY